VRAHVDQPSLSQNGDPVGQLERRAAVRDQQRGAPGHHLVQGGVDLCLGPRIDGGGGVVQDQDRRVVISALASDTRWRWPPDRVRPCSPMTVS